MAPTASRRRSKSLGLTPPVGNEPGSGGERFRPRAPEGEQVRRLADETVELGAHGVDAETGYQRPLAVDRILGDGLAHLAFGGGDVEKIVGELEGEAENVAEAREAAQLVVVCATKPGRP